MRRITSESAYEVITEKGKYLVVLEGLKNDVVGNRRFKARIINLDHITYAIVYRFEGHHLGEKGECEWIVKQYEKESN